MITPPLNHHLKKLFMYQSFHGFKIKKNINLFFTNQLLAKVTSEPAYRNIVAIKEESDKTICKYHYYWCNVIKAICSGPAIIYWNLR